MNSFTIIACTALLTAAVLIQPQATAQQQFTAGDTICFTVAAINANDDTIRDWDQTGSDCSIALVGSTANTDTSEQSWSKHPDGFSYAVILHNGAPLTMPDTNQWALPPSLFTDGKATLCLVHTKADTGVSITLCAEVQELQTVPVNYHYQPGPVENFLIEITSPHIDSVYLMRTYEIVVSPRDRFLNVSNQQVKCYFTARDPDEFVNSQPGFSSIFSGAVYIRGCTNYFVASTDTHTIEFGQWIVVIDSTTGAYGRSNPYAIIDHAPGAFELISPPDLVKLGPMGFGDTIRFRWERSLDDYSDIPISKFTGELGNDIITYTVHVVDSATLTKRVSVSADSTGVGMSLTVLQRWLTDIAELFDGQSDWSTLLWYVAATDGLYITLNTPHDPSRALPGRYLTITRYLPDAVSPIPSAPTGIALHQNFPNPVAAGGMANIRFETTAYGPVTMKVYDLLGREVATIANATLAPGSYNADFSATGLAPGVYHYTLIAGGKATTRSMVVTK